MNNPTDIKMTIEEARESLSQLVENILSLETNIKALTQDKTMVYKEAKAKGFDIRVLKAAVKRYRQLHENRTGVVAFDAILDLYMLTLGEKPSVPLNASGASTTDGYVLHRLALTQPAWSGQINPDDFIAVQKDDR